MIQGIYASNQGIVGDRVGDFASAILQINPTGNALMLALSSGMGKSAAKDTVFTWFEDSHQAGRSAVVSGGTTTTVTVADGSIYVPNQVLLVEETGELMLVNSIAGDALTVTRGLAGTTNTSVGNTNHVQSVGSAFEEASGMPTAIMQQGAPRLNYTQIFRNAWAVSGTAKAVEFRTGNRVAKSKADCAMYHAEDMERAMLWSKSHVGSMNNKPFRLTDGIISQVEKYGGIVEDVTDGSTPGNYSALLFDDYLRRIFSKNAKNLPNERIGICGDAWLSWLSMVTKLDSTYNIKQGETKVGIMVTTVETTFGKLNLMSHPLMNESPYFRRELYTLHPGLIRRRMLRETNQEGYDTNGNRINAVDADQGLMTTEFGVEVGGASTMGILRGLLKPVASDSAQLTEI